MEMPGWMASLMLRMGMLAEITVVGRKSGLERTAIINRKAMVDGTILVAAGGEDHQWARNLRAAGRCTLTVKGRSADYTATELDGAEAMAAAKSLAPPFTDPSSSVGGPVFRLEPAPLK